LLTFGFKVANDHTLTGHTNGVALFFAVIGDSEGNAPALVYD